MQNVKDISRTEMISQFVTKESLRVNVFGDNRLAERAYSRAERLVSATYLVIRHVDDAEPVKVTIREKGVLLIGSILTVRDSLRNGSEDVHCILSIVREIISCVRLMAVSGFVSFENADILSDAYDELAVFIESARRSPLAEAIVLSRDELGGNDARVSYMKRQTAQKDTGTVSVSETPLNQVPERVSETVTTDRVLAPGVVSPEKVARSERDRMLPRSRAETIIAILRESGPCGIKEIVLHAPEFSEKMIQRVLFDLVSSGVVVKNGSKRWSTYAIHE